MKHVFPANEIAHLWMHKTQDSARNQQGNFYFNGDTIYSYGSHFPIARHVENKHGQSAVLLTTRTYGSTTAQHVQDVRNAIPGAARVFRVYNPGSYLRGDYRSYAREFKAEIESACKQLKAARLQSQKAKAYRALVSAIDDANGFNRWAGFGVRFKLPQNAGMLMTLAADYDAKLEARRAERWANQERLQIQRRQAHEKAEEEIAARMPELIAAWQNGENPPELRGWGSNSLGRLPCMLRISAEEIETSLGARIPISHALHVLPLVRSIITAGRTYKANGHTIHLGHYSLDEITADGTIIAGCHRIMRSEFERFAPVLEALPISATSATPENVDTASEVIA